MEQKKYPPLSLVFTIFKYLLVFLPAVVSFVFIHKYALNIPSQDDYDAILNFLCAWKGAHGIDKFCLLFLQQSEHRILSSRIIYVLYDATAGNINFRDLIFTGNLQLLLTFFILIYFIRRALPRFWVITSFVAGLCLFDINNWENADFAMAAMQNYGVLFLFTASLFFYSLKRKWYWVPAVCLQVICTYSSGNGIPASGFLVLFNVLNRDVPEQNIVYGRINRIASTIVFLICSPLYFFHYQHISHDHLPSATKMITWFFRFVGQHIYIDDYALSVLAGIAIFCSLIIFLLLGKWNTLNRQNTPFVCLAGFLLASMAMVAVFRSGNGDYIPSRYLIYPHLMMALLFVCMLAKLQAGKVAIPAATVFSLIMLIAYNMNFRGGVKGMEKLSATLKSTDYYYPQKEVAKHVAEQACLFKIYCVEDHR